MGKAEVRAEKDRSWGYTGPFWRDPHTSVFSQKATLAGLFAEAYFNSSSWSAPLGPDR